MMLHADKSRGFTLVELMVVTAIIGIIAMIAYPSYLNYVAKARRSDAQGALMGLANAMERHFTANNSYKGAADGGDTGSPAIYPDEAPVDGSTKYYDLKISAADATSYTLQAVPKNDQAGDGFLQLTSTGIRSWDKNNDDAIGSTEKTWDQ